jgi:hypothetical protein
MFAFAVCVDFAGVKGSGIELFLKLQGLFDTLRAVHYSPAALALACWSFYPCIVLVRTSDIMAGTDHCDISALSAMTNVRRWAD